MTSHLIVNTQAGGYRPELILRLGRELADAGHSPRLHLVSTLAEARETAAAIQATEPHPYLLVAAGDGTINAVLNGLVPGRATLAVIPVGTANVLALELGIRSVDEALQRIRSGNRRPLAVGVVTSGGSRRYFSLMAGIGCDGAVVAAVNWREKQVLKKGAYLLAAMRTLRGWDRGTMTVTVGQERMTCHSVIVSNAARYGGDLLLAPGQDVAVPTLSVVCICSNRRRTYLRLALRFLLGFGLSGPDVRRRFGRELSIEGTKPIQVDGDAIGCAPARIGVIERFAQIIR
ncbi:diacylglycerol/lipid kinase family protein [Trichlorobacter ammonificans]|uniref:Diacylglycerol kinase, catalytic region n=1 Tax=Trichlorobacter ammonificans TaxID=2916410 RepID=A0ABN8HBF3_9BACT|nr:diacylglycerol kinase family protein [Trichlorobacter ammonificans]CAH2029855.1 Diacylglycerol kinase, catalytic region [Trichlorobacter ammonificans]